MNNEVKVEFNVGKSKVSTIAGVPGGNLPEDGRRVMTINNAVSQIKKDMGIDVKELIDDVYANAVLLYI